jgi:hypothetical protein
MKYEISGVDGQGKDRLVSVSASNERVALAKAKAAGISPYSVKAFQDKKPEAPSPEERKERGTEADDLFEGPYRYRMFQPPPTISVKEGVRTSQLAAHYLEDVVSRFAKEGWEFFRVDEIGIHVQPGCLAVLSGAGPARQSYYVITFFESRQIENHRLTDGAQEGASHLSRSVTRSQRLVSLGRIVAPERILKTEGTLEQSCACVQVWPLLFSGENIRIGLMGSWLQETATSCLVQCFHH